MFEAALKRAAEGILDAEGVRLTAAQLHRLLEAAPEDHERPGRRRVRVANFRRATFSGDAYFDGTTFEPQADFRGATFGGDAYFRGATFEREADFSGATFGGDAAFPLATFGGDADFGRVTFGVRVAFLGAKFGRRADFGRVTFAREAVFNQATFGPHADFSMATFREDAYFRATFGEYASFDYAMFGGNADFRGVTFPDYAGFAGVTVGGDADFGGARFEQARWLGPLLVCGTARLDRTMFGQQVRIELSSGTFSCGRAVFREGADLFVRWADVSLESADFAQPSLITELQPTHRSGREQALLGWEELAEDGTWRCPLDSPPDDFSPRVVSVRRAKVAELTLAGIDLRACLFVGAHNLDKLKLERVRLAYPPNGWRRVGRRRVRWTRRQTIAEERHWRHEHDYGSGWYEHEVKPPHWLADTAQPPHPKQIAAAYRALRKGLEDSKDEPGATDFYYGEMEMRRHSKQGRPHDRAIVSIIWLYWLFSGYGLRSGRALIALGVSIMLGAVLFSLFGFDAGRQPDDGILVFAAESSISLLRAPDADDLTPAGHVIQIVLRLAGPLCFGLALLALRARVKR